MPRAKRTLKADDAIGNIQGDLQSLRDDVSLLTQQLEGLLRDSGNDVVEDVLGRLSRAKSTVDDMIADAGAKGRDAARAARELGDNLVDDLEETVREHPIMTIAIALGVGYIISSLRR
jgi:ElaB/YqjD/DUF883 family membrane-anchored ribosome-binding protein